MGETLIARTYAEGLRPLGAAAERNHAVIAQAVASRLSPAHALMFSEPLPGPDGVATDWYARIEGPARRLDELGAGEAEAARDRIGALTRDVLQLADEWEAAGAEADRRLGEALRNAVEVPDVDAVWLVGDQPVLVSWAHSRDIDKAPRGVIRRFIPRRLSPPSPSRPPDPELARPAAVAALQVPWNLFWWLGWLLLAILMFWTLYLLLAPCGLRGPAFLNLDTCPGAASPVPAWASWQVPWGLLWWLGWLVVAMLALVGFVLLAGPRFPAAAAARRMERPAGAVEAVRQEGGKIGRINVILAWRDHADLDLSVLCPSGEEINFANRVAGGGELDVDANATSGEAMRRPVENIVFADSPRPGPYRVEVYLYDQRSEAGRPEHRFALTIMVGGEKTVHNASVSMDNRRWATSFDYGGNG